MQATHTRTRKRTRQKVFGAGAERQPGCPAGGCCGQLQLVVVLIHQLGRLSHALHGCEHSWRDACGCVVRAPATATTRPLSRLTRLGCDLHA
jgi:hypothetical protein